MPVEQYAFGPDMMRDFEARLQRDCVESSKGGVKGKEDRAAIIFDLLGEYIAATCEDLALSPSISINLLPHTHLVNYGGAYYSYLFAKMHASQIWQNQFADDPLSRYFFSKFLVVQYVCMHCHVSF